MAYQLNALMIPTCAISERGMARENAVLSSIAIGEIVAHSRSRAAKNRSIMQTAQLEMNRIVERDAEKHGVSQRHSAKLKMTTRRWSGDRIDRTKRLSQFEYVG
jgi:hypothetical protein